MTLYYCIFEKTDDGTIENCNIIDVLDAQYLPIPEHSNDPSTPDNGIGVYWNTSQSEMRVWNGSIWRALAWKLL